MIERIVPTENALGESVIWCHQTQRVWWVDAFQAQIHEWHPASSRHTVHQTNFRRLGSIALLPSGGLLLATDQGLFTRSPDRQQHKFATPEADPELRLNDGRCDRAGRFWVGSMHDPQFTPVGSLYCVRSDASATRFESNIIVPNSIAFSPDDRTFYFADTRRHLIWAYDFDIGEGIISNRRVFTSFEGRPGRPDGSCVDTDGCLWNTSFAGGQMVRYTPAGKVDRVIDLPVTFPTCCCFGGPGLDTLFITSGRAPLSDEQKAKEPLAGTLLAFNPGIKGLPEPLFGG